MMSSSQSTGNHFPKRFSMPASSPLLNSSARISSIVKKTVMNGRWAALVPSNHLGPHAMFRYLVVCWGRLWLWASCHVRILLFSWKKMGLITSTIKLSHSIPQDNLCKLKCWKWTKPWDDLKAFRSFSQTWEVIQAWHFVVLLLENRWCMPVRSQHWGKKL
jgi:hypothetical protein